jgi:hypothetical protein
VRLRTGLVAVWIGLCAAGWAGADVVVLKGGTVVPLKKPWERRGNTAYITRADGTLLSVPVTEIDRDATAAANRARPAEPAPAAAPAASTPAEAAKTAKEGPKSRVRITDADVSHPLDLSDTSGQEEKKDAAAAGAPRVEVADYSQDLKGETLLVKGTLRNVGQGKAENIRMTITAVDEKNEGIDGQVAGLSRVVLDPGQTADFTAALTVKDNKTVATLRFAPQWTVPRPPAPAAAAPAAPSAQSAGASAAPPPPRPTPYGRGTIYAPPVANAPSEAPADGKTGYIPGASHPDNQPRPPSQ